MKVCVQILLTLAGFAPLAAGIVLDHWMIENIHSVPPFKWIAISLLLVWFILAFLAKCCLKDTKKVVVLLNFASFANLILLGIQELIFHRYFPNILGLWPQFFFLPLLDLGFQLTPFFHTVFSACFICSLLLVLVSIAGSSIKRTGEPPCPSP